MKYKMRRYASTILMGIGVLSALVGAITFNLAAEILDSYYVPLLFMAFGALITAVAAAGIIMQSRLRAEASVPGRVFVIYSRKDITAVREVVDLLKKNGLDIWLDVDNLVPGQVWQESVMEALQQSSIALVMLSKNLTQSSFAHTELEFALDVLQGSTKNASPVIPVRLDDSQMPRVLSHIHWVDLAEPQGTERLIAALKQYTTQAVELQS